MIDTHTHILPGMDDGAQTPEESIRMLRRCRAQGVETVVLTPHFLPACESAEGFLARRNEAFARLQAAASEDLPRLVLGAEVAWCPGLEKMSELTDLTMGSSNYLLLEMPFMAWTQEHLAVVRDLIHDGRVIPVIAHVERFLQLQWRGQYQALKQLQVPMQLSASLFQRPLGGVVAQHLLRQGQWMVGSDCHDLTRRKPCMDIAAKYMRAHIPNWEQFLHWEL